MKILRTTVMVVAIGSTHVAHAGVLQRLKRWVKGEDAKPAAATLHRLDQDRADHLREAVVSPSASPATPKIVVTPKIVAPVAEPAAAAKPVASTHLESATKPPTSALHVSTTPARPLESSSASRSESEYRWQPPPRAPLPYEKLPEARRAAISKLLKQPGRPTLEQLTETLKEAFDGKLPDENPFGHSSTVKAGTREQVAQMVAQLEHAYPGGTYLPLGKDAVLIADLLHGFYKSIGQPERVRRLDMSGLSLPHYRDAGPHTFEADRPIIYGFLKSNGLDLEHLEGKPHYVMIDVTTYNPTSQSTQLMRSTFRTWAKMGKDPKALNDHVAFVGLSTISGPEIDQVGDRIEVAKAELKANTTTDGPQRILFLGRGSTQSLTYTTGWHSDFEKFESDGKGGYTAPIGRPTSEGSRTEILAELYDVAKLTSSPELLRDVKQLAESKYGYAFPMQRTEKLERTRPLKVAEPAAQVRIEPAATPVATRVEPRAELSAAIERRMKTSSDKHEVAMDFLGDIAGMWSRKTLSNADTKQIVRQLNHHVQLAARPADMASLYAKYPDFQRVVAKALKSK